MIRDKFGRRIRQKTENWAFDLMEKYYIYHGIQWQVIRASRHLKLDGSLQYELLVNNSSKKSKKCRVISLSNQAFHERKFTTYKQRIL